MPADGIDIAAVLAFIADNEPLTATLARFASEDETSLRAALRRMAAALQASGVKGPAAQPAAAPAHAQRALFDTSAAQDISRTVQTTAKAPAARSASASAKAKKSEGKRLIIYSDGASRGNPGLSGAGWVICDASGKTIATGGMFLGTRTNNEAEYLAAAMGIQAARDLGAEEVVLRADSELMVRQLQGRYQVRNSRLLPLFNQITVLRQSLKAFYAEHVPREQNAAADACANQAIDDR